MSVEAPVIVHVAVGVILNQVGQVLIARRPDSVHQGGLLEFPGGKCELGESIEDALSRELQEELGIRVLDCHPLCKIQHDYGDKHVLLDVWIVDQFAGQPLGREGQPLQWLSIHSLSPTDFPAANRSIITHLQMPESIAITGTSDSDDDFYRRFDALLATDVAMLQLRAKDLSLAEFSSRARKCLARCRSNGKKMVINAHLIELLELEADGYHIGAELAATLQQRPLPDSVLLGVSCHDRQQLEMAQNLGADYAFLSPVLATRSHPEASPMGWSRFAELAAEFNLPVVALGGMGREDGVLAKRNGAVGLASISAFWPA
jgi:8-oxo-dGTP diphosphatase